MDIAMAAERVMDFATAADQGMSGVEPNAASLIKKEGY
jgi:hypothetical protein